MVSAQMKNFTKIISIELSDKYFKMASNKFAFNDNVSIIHGDSAEVLVSIMPKIKNPCLFWLDGHYSGGDTAHGKNETPIIEELKAILSHKFQHVIHH
jgi:hypothetical protein